MTKSITVTSRSSYHYNNQPANPHIDLIEAINAKKEIWYEFTDGAREGSIGKITDLSGFSVSNLNNYQSIHLPSIFHAEVAPGKLIKVGVPKYNCNIKFLIDYDGDYVSKFEKGKPKSLVTETLVPDMLGNTIKVGDWVISATKNGRPRLGKLNRLSVAGNAWIMVTNKQGEEVEQMTDGASTLIKVEFTPELHTTYMLYDGFAGLRTKLKLDLDYEAMENGK